MLSAGATAPQFRRVLEHAYRAGASGYLAGRAIWWDSFQHFPDLAAMTADLKGAAAGYFTELNDMTDAQARPWSDWLADARPEGADSECFQSAYADLEGRA